MADVNLRLKTSGFKQGALDAERAGKRIRDALKTTMKTIDRFQRAADSIDFNIARTEVSRFQQSARRNIDTVIGRIQALKTELATLRIPAITTAGAASARAAAGSARVSQPTPVAAPVGTLGLDAAKQATFASAIIAEQTRQVEALGRALTSLTSPAAAAGAASAKAASSVGLLGLNAKQAELFFEKLASTTGALRVPPLVSPGQAAQIAAVSRELRLAGQVGKAAGAGFTALGSGAVLLRNTLPSLLGTLGDVAFTVDALGRNVPASAALIRAAAIHAADAFAMLGRRGLELAELRKQLTVLPFGRLFEGLDEIAFTFDHLGQRIPASAALIRAASIDSLNAIAALGRQGLSLAALRNQLAVLPFGRLFEGLDQVAFSFDHLGQRIPASAALIRAATIATGNAFTGMLKPVDSLTPSFLRNAVASSALTGAYQNLSRIAVFLQGPLSGIGARVIALTGIGQSLGATAVGLTVSLAAVGLAMLKAVKNASAFQTQLVGVAKTTGIAGTELARLGKNLLQMSSDLGVSAVEIGQIAVIAGQLGISGATAIEKFTETVAVMSRVTNLSTEAAASGLAVMLNVTNESAEDVGRLGDAIVALGNNFAATESQIIENSTEVAKATAIFGLTSVEAAAIGTALKAAGVDAAAGGTAIGRVIFSIQDAARRGGESLQHLAEITGLAAEEIRVMALSQPADAFNAFITGLGRIKDEGRDAVTVLRDFGLQGIREAKALLPLANNVGQLSNAFRVARTAAAEGGAAQQEFNIASQSLSRQLEILGTRVGNIFVSFGDQLLPVVTAVVKLFNALVVPTEALGTIFGQVSKFVLATAAAFVVLKGAIAAVTALGGLASLTFLFGAGFASSLGGIALGLGALAVLLPQAGRGIAKMANELALLNIATGGVAQSARKAAEAEAAAHKNRTEAVKSLREFRQLQEESNNSLKVSSPFLTRVVTDLQGLAPELAGNSSATEAFKKALESMRFELSRLTGIKIDVVDIEKVNAAEKAVNELGDSILNLRERRVALLREGPSGLLNVEDAQKAREIINELNIDEQKLLLLRIRANQTADKSLTVAEALASARKQERVVLQELEDELTKLFELERKMAAEEELLLAGREALANLSFERSILELSSAEQAAARARKAFLDQAESAGVLSDSVRQMADVIFQETLATERAREAQERLTEARKKAREEVAKLTSEVEDLRAQNEALARGDIAGAQRLADLAAARDLIGSTSGLGTVTSAGVSSLPVQFTTPEGRPLIMNPDGSISTEVTATVTDPRINEGLPTNIPTIIGGQLLSVEDAIKRIGGALQAIDPDTGRFLESFESIDAAVAAAEKRSASFTPVVDRMADQMDLAARAGVDVGKSFDNSSLSVKQFGRASDDTTESVADLIREKRELERQNERLAEIIEEVSDKYVDFDARVIKANGAIERSIAVLEVQRDRLREQGRATEAAFKTQEIETYRREYEKLKTTLLSSDSINSSIKAGMEALNRELKLSGETMSNAEKNALVYRQRFEELRTLGIDPTLPQMERLRQVTEAYEKSAAASAAQTAALAEQLGVSLEKAAQLISESPFRDGAVTFGQIAETARDAADRVDEFGRAVGDAFFGSRLGEAGQNISGDFANIASNAEIAAIQTKFFDDVVAALNSGSLTELIGLVRAGNQFVAQFGDALNFVGSSASGVTATISQLRLAGILPLIGATDNAIDRMVALKNAMAAYQQQAASAQATTEATAASIKRLGLGDTTSSSSYSSSSSSSSSTGSLGGSYDDESVVKFWGEGSPRLPFSEYVGDYIPSKVSDVIDRMNRMNDAITLPVNTDGLNDVSMPGLVTAAGGSTATGMLAALLEESKEEQKRLREELATMRREQARLLAETNRNTAAGANAATNTNRSLSSGRASASLTTRQENAIRRATGSRERLI